MKFEFVGDAYRSRSVNANSQQTINLFPEVDPTGKNVIALYGTPGYVNRVQLGDTTGVVRAAFEYDGTAYFVRGDKFYSSTTGYVDTELGTLTTSTGQVFMCTNGLVILIVDGTDGYTFTISGATFATIADADFPANPTRCDILDGTFVVIDGGTQRYSTSTTGTAWAPLEFASAEAQPDDLLSVISDHQELLFGGVKTIEVWYNDGGTPVTFSRRTVIETGVAGVGAMTKADNSVFFLGSDGVVWRLNGYTPVRVSTHAIEYAINQYIRSDVLMWTQKEEGHVFVWMTFPTGNETWVYDVAAGPQGMWHRRAWRDPDTGVMHRHRANCYVFFNNKHFIGDFENGKVYELDLDIYDDDGDELAAVRICGHIQDGDINRVRHHSLQIDVEAGVGLVSGQGSDPQMMLLWSDDGGHSYGNEIWRTMGIGPTGGFKARAKWHRLGTARDRVYWAEITDPVKRVILGASLKTSAGIS